jgi:hypothetical protein
MMHPYVSELIARQWIESRMREGERQRMARGVRPEDGPRNEVGRKASAPEARVIGAWVRS